MRVIGTIVCLLLSLTANAESGSQRLLGAWKSNRELTLATFKYVPPMSPKGRALFEGLFGKLTITYELARVCSRFPDETGEPTWMDYRVIIEHGDVLLIESYEPLQKANVRVQITFEGANRYWIHLDEAKGTREYFDRLPSTQRPNQSLEPTPTAVTPAAGQPTRQP
jgi:hypothetical protein